MVNSVCLAFAHGCIRAEMEISVLAAYFAANNVKVLDTPTGADLILVSACGFDKCAEQTSIKLLKKIIGRKDQASQLAITGCLPAINQDRVRAEFGDGVLLLPAKSIGLLDGIIGAKIPFTQVLEAGDLSHGFIETDVRLRPEQVKRISGAYEGSSSRARKVFDRLERLHAGLSLSRATFDKALARLPQTLRLQFVQQSQDMVPGLLLSRGCDAHCTYCAIPEAVGPLRSLPLEAVVDNFSKMLAQGQSIASLIATDVGAYGVDRGSSILELLHKLFAFPEPFELIINDFHPIWVIRYGAALRDLFAAHADRIDYIVIPTQSGSDRILKLMGRSHSAEDAKKALLALKEAVPGIQIGTHIMVGFPGESKEDFNRTIDFVRAVDFSYLKVFRYDDRPNIASTRLPEKVSDNIKRRRLMRLLREFPMLVK